MKIFDLFEAAEKGMPNVGGMMVTRHRIKESE